MPNLVEVSYNTTGQSTSTNPMGMRQMQERAFEARNAQYLLLKAPPASGKSRALMFLGLDKLHNQGISKVIVAVPERSIGGSFGPTNLTQHGFFADWQPSDRYNLCTPGDYGSKTKLFQQFMAGNEQILICTHATLRYAYEHLNDEVFNNCLLAIDEFHHVSADKESSKLGNLLHGVMSKSTAHVVAMTGSYFRGDGVPVLLPEDEAKFERVTYNYYEQLNGYDYLKTLGIGYHFYQGKYMSALPKVLDTTKKTIVHIPNVNSGESTKDKYDEVDRIIEVIGEVQQDLVELNAGWLPVKCHKTGRILKVVDLVDETGRDDKVAYLRRVNHVDDVDIIIALGMAKEGFDWPYCEHALTVAYRGSLTEVIQIIGRCTRDSNNKTHAQFTNLIAQPDAADDSVVVSVNNMLKAITASLLMEQVLAPNFVFKRKQNDDDMSDTGAGVVKIKGFKEPKSDKVKKIVDSDLNDLKAYIMQNPQMLKAMPGESGIVPEMMNQVLIPKIIKEKYPDLNNAEVEELRQSVVVDSVVKNGELKEADGKKFIKMANTFVNIDDLNIDLIDTVNPFQRAFEVLSKQVTKQVLRAIYGEIQKTKIDMTEEEFDILWPKVQLFVETHNRKPEIDADDPLEQRLARAVMYVREQQKKQGVYK